MEWAGAAVAPLFPVLTIYIIALTVQASSARYLMNVDGVSSRRGCTREWHCMGPVLQQRSVQEGESGKGSDGAVSLFRLKQSCRIVQSVLRFGPDTNQLKSS